MGNDLISRNVVMDYLREQQANVIVEKNKNGFVSADVCDGMSSAIDAFINFIVQAPTAYDVDKATEEISEQVSTLRDLAASQDALHRQRIINRAADTIESLSAKLQAENMEKSEVYYGGRKQRALTINVQIGEDDTPADIMQLLTETIDETNDKGYAVMNALVDGVEAFDYKGFSKEFFDGQKENHEP